MEVKVTVYGGAAGYRPGDGPPAQPEGEVGGNRILLEWEERRWLLDFGARFKLAGRYYEEFLL